MILANNHTVATQNMHYISFILFKQWITSFDHIVVLVVLVLFILGFICICHLLCFAQFVRTSFGSRSFSVAAPKIWNSLPPAVRMCTSHDTFRHQLKAHYFQLAFQPTLCFFSCTSDSALADHCARLQIIFTYLLTYLLTSFV